MTTNISLNDPDSTKALIAMLSALDAEGALTDHQEMVAQNIISSGVDDLPDAAFDDLDDEVAAIRDRL